ncbi:hypothetical protein HZB03_02995 [Candidatus Woesearchaeota archaeon]|nr:hypothetical protein [Candidatus Woesearchaeota archaeon]
MALSHVKKVLSKGKYWAWFLIPSLIIMILYLTVFVNVKNFGAQGPGYFVFNWSFAIVMPFLIGLVFAVQVYNLKEARACPRTSTTSGIFGGIIGVATVACPMCPAVFLGWLGLAAAIPSAILSSIWVKSLSLVLLVAALLFGAKGRQ